MQLQSSTLRLCKRHESTSLGCCCQICQLAGLNLSFWLRSMIISITVSVSIHVDV